MNSFLFSPSTYNTKDKKEKKDVFKKKASDII